MNTKVIKVNSSDMYSEIVGVEGDESPEHSRRSAMQLMIGAGLASIGLSSCSVLKDLDPKIPGIGAGILTIAALILENKGDYKNAKKVRILIAILALTAVVLAYYQATSSQKSYVMKNRSSLDKKAARLAPNKRYVAVKTTQPSKTPRKKYTSKGRQVEEGRKAVSIAGKSFAPKPEPVMIYDTQKRTLKSSTVYEVSNPKKKQNVALAGNNIPYVD